MAYQMQNKKKKYYDNECNNNYIFRTLPCLC